MSDHIKLNAIHRRDRDGRSYYFTKPDIPASVDLSSVVIFVYLNDGEQGEPPTADIVFRKAMENKDK